jgi:hypothetical protein
MEVTVKGDDLIKHLRLLIFHLVASHRYFV